MIQLFPVLVHDFQAFEFENDKDDIIRYAHAERIESPRGEINSNEGGWQSRKDLNKEDSILRKVLTKSLESYLNSGIFFSGVSFHLNSMWININTKNHYNILHTHPCSDLSGVIYIKNPHNGGKIVFRSPHEFTCFAETHSYTEEINKKYDNYGAYWMDPKEGTILMFPSMLQHSVTPNGSDEERITASFNITVSGWREGEERMIK
tara:strand:+ start:320 stop:937 length:618 start_codon:yes stop_codon:yes gene_type:complete